MALRLTSRLTQVSKPVFTATNQATNTLYKKVLPAPLVSASEKRVYNRNIAAPQGQRVQSVLAGNGRRNYSTEVESARVGRPVNKEMGAPLTGDHVRPVEAGKDGRVLGYFLLGTNRALVSTGIRLLVLKLLYSWSANARVMALASVEVDLAAIPEGKTITITFRGKPVFIKHRTPKEILAIQADESNLAVFRDPELDADRFPLDQNWTVVLAICTHLGCVPVTDSGRWNAFFCPCHGSHYDASGRIRAGPAPLNLAIPPMKFTDHNTIILG